MAEPPRKRNSWRVGGCRRASAPGGKTSQPGQPKKREDNALVANLDPRTKCDDGQGHGGSGQVSHRRQEPAGEAKPMKKAEEKSHEQTGAAAAAKRPANILECDDHDAEGDHRLDNFGATRTRSRTERVSVMV